MSFYLKYELSRLLHADGAKTFQAVEKSTRRNVLLHLVEKSASPHLVAKIKLLDTAHDRDLIEVGEFAGSYFIVTRAMEDFAGLDAWLDQRSTDSGAAPPAPSPPAAKLEEFPAPPPAPVETASALGRPLGRSTTAPSVAAPPAPPPLTGPATAPTLADLQPPPRVTEESGEFTRLFGQPKLPAPPPAPAAIENVAAAPAAVTPQPATEESGEFTRLFGQPKPPQPAAPPPPPMEELAAPRAAVEPQPAAEEAGEFTLLFGGAASSVGTQPVAPPLASPVKDQPRQAPKKEETSGEFTRKFVSPRVPAAPLPPPPQPAAPPAASAGSEVGAFTQLFGAEPAAKEAPPPRPAPAPAPARASAEVTTGPGEFTQVFGGAHAKPETPAVRLKPVTPGSNSAGDFERGSGEFTRLFGPGGKAPAGPSKPAAEAPPPLSASPLETPLGGANGAPGDFTLMFGGSSAASSPGYGGAAAPRPPAASFGEGLVGEISGDEALAADKAQGATRSAKPFRAPGEFTRMFGSSDPNQAHVEDFIPAARPGGGEGYASGLFQNPHSGPKQPSGAASALGGEPSRPAAPGDYTMTFERASAPSSIPSPAAQPAPPQAAITPVAPVSSKPSKWMMLALIAALLIAGLSLGAAVYLFLNRGTGDAGQAQPQTVEQPATPGAN